MPKSGRGVKIIRAESLIQKLYTMGYAYDNLHNFGDYHPTEGNGYTASILMFHTIFNKKSCLKKILNKAEKIRKKTR